MKKSFRNIMGNIVMIYVQVLIEATALAQLIAHIPNE